jgi:DNA polymerase
MSDPSSPDPAEVGRQLRQHLDSLKAAGIDWLPASNTAQQPPATAATGGSDVASSPGKATGEPPVATSPPTPLPVVSQGSLLAGADSAGDETPETRQRELAALAARVAECTRCPHLASTRTQTVFGVGPIDPELCFIGEAPGATEDARGEPFVGEAGQLLNRIITAMGMRREDVFICNIIRCRPPGNRLPNAEEASHCREYLDRTLELVRPHHICCLGACAAQNLLGTTQGIGRMRGRVFRYTNIPVVCTYHPAYLLRNPADKRAVWEDMQKLLVLMGRSIPGKG